MTRNTWDSMQREIRGEIRAALRDHIPDRANVYVLVSPHPIETHTVEVTFPESIRWLLIKTGKIGQDR